MICRSRPDKGDEGNTETHSHEVHQGPVAGQHPHTDHLVKREKCTINFQQNEVTIVNNDQGAAPTPMETVTERSSARVNLPQRPSEIFPFVEEHGCTRYWGATDSTSGTRAIYIWDIYGLYMAYIWAIHGQYMGNAWAMHGQYMGNTIYNISHISSNNEHGWTRF